MTLAVGDRVRLNACGPMLFAQAAASNVHVTCTWMDEMGQRHSAEFPRDALLKVDGAGPDQTSHDRPTRHDRLKRLTSRARRMPINIFVLALVGAATTFILR